MKALAVAISLPFLAFGQVFELRDGFDFRNDLQKRLVTISEDSVVIEESWTVGMGICMTVHPMICVGPTEHKIRVTYKPIKGKLVEVRADTGTYTPPIDGRWEFK